jgi:hypothetical protein
VAAVALGAAFASACYSPEPRPAPPPPPPLAEEPLAPSRTIEFQIGPITQTASDDGRTLFVQGSVRNTGSTPSRDVKVWVEGLDAGGARIAVTEGLPTPQAIPPGGAGTFVVQLPNDPAITEIHVEAVGR